MQQSAKIIEFLQEWYDNSSDSVCAHTSGSSGSPKAIRLPKRDMIASAMATNRYFGINEDSVLGLPLSVDYIAGKMMVVRSLEARCALHCLPVSSAIDIDREISLLSLVPAQAESLLLGENRSALIHNILLGGASVSPDLERRLVDAGYNAFIGYGMTETCSHVALRKLGSNAVYHAMDGVNFSVDPRGCLIVNMPRREVRKIVTNDRVKLFDSKNFIWLGRADLVINSGGRKLFMDHLEQLYADCGLQGKYYVAKTSDKKWGERPVLVIEKDRCGEGNIAGNIQKDGTFELTEESVMNLLSEALDSLYLPKIIKIVESLPLTTSGKPIREFNTFATL